jgi:hypothetical protein
MPPFPSLLALLAPLMLLAPSIVIVGPNAAKSSPSVLKVAIPSFTASGTFEEILVQLAVKIREDGVIGFEPVKPSGSRLSLSLQASTVRDIIHRLCAMDKRYRVVSTQDPRVINVLATQWDDASQLLETRVPQFDMVVDVAQELVYASS